MAANGRSRYSPKDKARILAVLASNGGNIKRTARETKVPINTVRRWKTQAAQGGGPPQAMVVAAVGEFVGDAERIRDKALAEIESMIDAGLVDARTLNTIMGTLDDKIRLAKGMPTQRTEHTGGLPGPDEARELMRGFAQGLIDGARQRDGEIIDAEIVAEIPPATSNAG